MLGWVSLALARDVPGDPAETIPASDPVALLQWFTARDGVRLDPTLLDERLDRACAEGDAVACALRPLEPGDLQALPSSLAPLCEAGDGAACLGQAWAQMPHVLLGGDSNVEPARVRALLERACEAGVQRACTEIGTLYALGIGTYVGQRQAEDRWAAACDAGEPHACTLLGVALRDRAYLEDGLRGGDASAWMGIAEHFPGERPLALQRACEAGATAGCVALAERWLAEGRPLYLSRQMLEPACRQGDPVACAWRLRIDASVGVVSREHASTVLRGLCPAVSWACEQADFLQSSPPAPVHLAYPGRNLIDRDVRRELFDRRGELEECAAEWLTRVPQAQGVVDLVLQVEPDGRVSGVSIASAPDLVHARCVAGLIQGMALHRSEGGPVRIELSLPVYHGAEVKFDPLFPGEGGYDPARLTMDAPVWAVAADRCLLSTVGPERDHELTLRFQAMRDGSARAISVMESSEEPALDQCMVDWLAGHRFIEPVALPLAAKARVRFLRFRDTPVDADLPQPTSAAPASPPLPSAGTPTPVRLLVLIADRGLLAGRPARMSKAARRSIEGVHRALEGVVQEYTHGALSLQTTVRELPVLVRSVRQVGDEFVPDPWVLRPEMLERELLAAIEPGQWDAVLVWIPTLGLPQAPVGVTLDATTVRGATFSALPVPGGRAVQLPHGLPAWELPLRALWRQAVARADRLVGVELPPDTEPIERDRHVFDPRSWADPPSHSVLSWFSEAMGPSVHPELWRDLWRGPELPDDRPRQVSPNLAQHGRPIGDGVLHLEGLNDTLVDFGRFANLPSGDPDATAISFGLEWRQPVRFGLVVAHVGDRADPSRPSFRDPALEVLGPDLQWVPIEAQVEARGSEIHFTFGPVAAYGVRLVVVDGAVAPVCRELEVR